MKNRRLKTEKLRILMLVTVFFTGFFRPALAEEVENSWDETKRVHYLRRPVSTAISVYTKGNNEDITHEEGILDGITYDILRVNPSEDTLVQVDYSESPAMINQMKDYNRISQGYAYAGGINAGYFENGGGEGYGKPVGAVRRYGDWTTWYGIPNTPAYGNGFATAYIDGDVLKLRYHGWAGNSWCGDGGWTWWGGYTIDGGAFGVSGSYTYFADGKEVDITGGSSNGINYRSYGRAVTILAQKSDLQFLLITIYGTVAESRIRDFLRELGAFDAIRFDGGGSTQMVYETDLVKNVPPQLEWTEKPLANEEIEEESLGYLIVEASSLEYHDKPELREEPEKTEKAAKPEEKKDTKDSAESKEEGEESEAPSVATYGERYQVYEMKEADGSTWYRIGESIWILASEDEVQYFGNDEIEKSRAISDQETYQIRINARNLQARKAPSADAAVIATTREGSVYTVFETTEDAAYTWYRIGKKHWIAALPGWIERTDEGIQADGVFDNEAEEEAEEEQPAGETAPADVPGEIPAEFVVEPYEVPQEAVTE